MVISARLKRCCKRLLLMRGEMYVSSVRAGQRLASVRGEKEGVRHDPRLLVGHPGRVRLRRCARTFAVAR